MYCNYFLKRLCVPLHVHNVYDGTFISAGYVLCEIYHISTVIN